jgi:hypothetical protein
MNESALVKKILMHEESPSSSATLFEEPPHQARCFFEELKT